MKYAVGFFAFPLVAIVAWKLFAFLDGLVQAWEPTDWYVQ